MNRSARRFEIVSEGIASEINSGTLVEGALLPSERDLAEQYGVSRISVREALLSLQSSGLIELRDRARARVKQLRTVKLLAPMAGAAQSLLTKPGGISDFQEARIFFECGLARFAARHASPKEIARLGEALLANKKAIGNVEMFIATDMAFHAVLAELPRNSIFVALNASLADWLIEQRRLGMKVRGAARRAYQHHEAVFQAIAAHSPEEADKAMSNHLTVGARFIHKVST